MTTFNFSPKKISQEIEKKLAIKRLPSWAQSTEQIQKYFDDAIQYWFTPEQQRTLDGYIGQRSGPNSTGKVYINEHSHARNEYQFAPSMVSTDAQNTVQTMLTYPDLVDNLAYNGALGDNETRLLAGNFYSWAPPVNPDMMVNFSNYYWDTQNEDGFVTPEYICMERGSQDGNIWSAANHWYPIQYTDVSGAKVIITNEDIRSGRFVQAQRPVIEYVKDIELFNFGRNTRGTVDLVSELLTPEDIMFRNIGDGIKIDNAYIRKDQRILFTSINNAGENNRIYKVTIKKIDNVDVYGLTLDTSEMNEERPTGEAMLYDTVRVTKGDQYKNIQMFWDGKQWVKGQQKYTHNQHPMFMMYNKEATALNDTETYPNSSFNGSRLFSIKEDNTRGVDVVYGISTAKDKLGDPIYINNIASDTFTFNKSGADITIPGMKFYKVMHKDAKDDEIFSDWREGLVQTRQHIVQTIVPQTIVLPEDIDTGRPTVVTDYELAVTVGENPTGVTYPLVHVDVSGDDLDSTEYEIIGNKIKIKRTITVDDTIKVLTYNGTEVPNKELGAYEIPYNLKHNAQNADIKEIGESKLAEHFFDLIANQVGFIGSSVGTNNYYNTPRDLSRGRKIVQHDASLLPLMLHNASDRLDIINASDYVKGAYNSFRAKFQRQLETVHNTGYNNKTAADVVAQILKTINIGKSDDFAFWLSGMGVTQSIPQTFIPPTPQYLGIASAYTPRVRVRMNLGQGVRLYNVSHTGAVSNAFSRIQLSGTTESTIRDYRDDVIFELEMMLFRSIDARLRSEDYLPKLSIFDVRPGAFRVTDYSRDEWDKLALRGFEQWAISNRVSYDTHTNYDASRWETWNYGSTTYNANNAPARGNWRGIYMDHFDTLYPNTKPWEMLGFTQKPEWFDGEYTDTVLLDGVVTYVDAKLWSDIETGTIRGGKRQGVHAKFKRPGFNMHNPIDADGSLVAPHLHVVNRAALVSHAPSAVDAEASWKFGDIGDMEYSYINSNYYSFEQAMTLYRAKPAQWSNYFWEPTKYDTYTISNNSQWLRDGTDTRFVVTNDTLVHGENNQRRIGYQMWVSDFLKHNHMDITRNYGNYLRGADVRLTYRLGGFSKKENITFVSDSFGLVSQENQQLTLSKSAVRRQEIMSGLKITWDRGDYVISGYNPSTPYFKYYEPVRTGKRHTVKVGTHTFVQYQEHKEVASELKYDTRLSTAQEVYEFMIGYGEYLEQHGWIFEDLTDDGEYFDWRVLAYKFINWSLEKRKVDDFITLTPFARSAKFAAEHGHIESVAQYSGGAWTLIDDKNTGISMHEINVARVGNIMNVRVNDEVDKRMMLIRLNVVEYEHCVVFDNTTIFGDVMYLPVQGLHQMRLRAYGNITDGWNGRLEAPGFMVVDNHTLPNFEKLVNDFTKYYDSENPTSSVELNNLARHFIGFQSREYIRRLILNDRNQLDFYKGYIKEKGTLQSFDKVLRASKNLRTPDFKVLEEWAFKIGDYGDINNTRRLEFVMQNSDLKQEPQRAIFDSSKTSENLYDDHITFFGKKGSDTRWITRSSESQAFPLVDAEKVTIDLPSVGPINLTEADVVAANIREFSEKRIAASDRGLKPKSAWIFNDAGQWSLRNIVASNSVITNVEPDPETNTTTLTFSFNHNMIDGDIYYMESDVSAIDSKFRVARYFTSTSANSGQTIVLPGLLSTPNSDLVRLYVARPQFGNNERRRNSFIKSRNVDVVDMRAFDRPVIYNKVTNSTDMYLTLWDPRQGVIPGIADAEVKFRLQYDPALYNNVDTHAAAWGKEHVGDVWWDTSTALYLDYYQPVRKADGSIDEEATSDYRRKNWGRLLPGGEITLYEWVRSPVHPVEWDEYVTSQATQNKSARGYSPSGDAYLNNWTVKTEYDVNTNTAKEYYYFWVKNAIYVPEVTHRTRPVAELNKIIRDPSSANLAWFAPINKTEFVVSGITDLVTNNDSVLQIIYKNDVQHENNVHKQWQLFKEGTDYNFDPDIWQHLVDSLVGETLPDAKEVVLPTLYPQAELGNGRGKTWFRNVIEARREFVKSCNLFFATTNMGANANHMKTVFNYSEGKSNPYVRDFTVVRYDNQYLLRIKDSARFKDGDAILIDTNGTLPKPLDKSIVYFVERHADNAELFIVKSAPTALDGITIIDKGLGQHNVVRDADAKLTTAETLDMREYWSTIDWYADGYSADTPYVNVASLQLANTMKFESGDVVRLTEENGQWTLYMKDDSRKVTIWKTVGRKNSTIELNSRWYDYDTVDATSTHEKLVRRAIRLMATVFDGSQSRLVFPMVYYVCSEQHVIDWVFKTSYIHILGIDKALTSQSVSHTDPIIDVLEYFKEVKPYRTKIRNTVDQRTSDSEIAQIKAQDVDPSDAMVQKYREEEDKQEQFQNFADISTGFRQQGQMLFFDNVQDYADTNLKDQGHYAQRFSQFMQPYDPVTLLPEEIQVSGSNNTAFNGIYTEILDYKLLPAFPSEFHTRDGDIMIDRTKKLYIRTEAAVEHFIWFMVGSGWVISTNKANGVDWYYEATPTPGMYASSPDDVSSWYSAGRKPARSRAKTKTGIFLTVKAETRNNPDLQHNIERVRRNTSAVVEQVGVDMFKAINEHVTVTPAEWSELIYKFATPTSEGSVYHNAEAFQQVCYDLGIFDDKIITNILRKGASSVDDIMKYMSMANRVKLANPSATDEYIYEITNAGFKGRQVTNNPQTRLPFGYSPTHDDSLTGYYIWSTGIYEQLVKSLTAQNVPMNEIHSRLVSMGYAAILPYVPYIGSDTLPITKSLWVKAVNGSLDDMPYDAANPLQNQAMNVVDGYVDDVNAYDNLGYDKGTKSVVVKDVPEDTYLFDISELRVVDKELSQFKATISDYAPDQFMSVDYGVFTAPNVMLPNSTVGILNEDFGQIESPKVTNVIWDFGTQYGAFGESRIGQFSVECSVIRDPNNPHRVVVSAPRTIKPIAEDWDRGDFVYKNNDKVIYPFSLTPMKDITSIRIGKNTVKKGDKVILLANDPDMPMPTGANFNDVTSVYTIWSVDGGNVTLVDHKERDIKLDGSHMIADLAFGSAPLFSMFVLNPIPSATDIRVDVMNYDAYYGRIINGGKLSNKMAKSGDHTISLNNHELHTGDKIKFTSVYDSYAMGGIEGDKVYYAIVHDTSSFSVTRTIDDALLGTNLVTIGTDISKASMTVVNYWLTSTIQTKRKNATWYEGLELLSYEDKIKAMQDLFDENDELNANNIEIHDHGFARPTVDAGSLSEKVRLRGQEHVSFTVYQDDRSVADSSKVYSTDGIHMYNTYKSGAKPYTFRLDQGTDGDAWKVSTLVDTDTANTVTDLRYSDDSVVVDAFIPSGAVIEVNGEYIEVNDSTPFEQGGNTVYRLTNLRRGTQYTNEAQIIPAGTRVVLLNGADQIVDRSLYRTNEINNTLANTAYSHSTTILFDHEVDGDKVTFESLKALNTSLATQLKRSKGTFDVLGK